MIQYIVYPEAVLSHRAASTAGSQLVLVMLTDVWLKSELTLLLRKGKCSFLPGQGRL